MSKPLNLSLSNVINVSVVSPAVGLSLPNVNTIALFTSDQPSPSWSEEYKLYTSASEVETDFGSASETHRQAVAVFAQKRNVLSTGGYLVVVPKITGEGGEETLQVAIARVIDKVYFFGIVHDAEISGQDFLDLCTYMQSIDKLLFYASATGADIESGGKFDIVRTSSSTHVRCIYRTDTVALARLQAVAEASRLLSVDYSGSNTAITLHMKELMGITVDPGITQTILDKCVLAGVDCYCSIAGMPGIFSSGTNMFSDEIYGELWLKIAVQVSGFNVLRQTNYKIPQTEEGIGILKNGTMAVLDQAVRCGLVAPGAWDSPDSFGDRESLIRCVGDIGYYVYSIPVSKQATADRQARKAPLISVAVKMAGAVHSSDQIINVNL